MYLRSEFWDANAKKERKRKREEKRKKRKGGKVHHASKLASSRIAVCWNCRSLRASGCWSVGSSLPDQFLRPKSICRSRRVSLLLYRAIANRRWETHAHPSINSNKWHSWQIIFIRCPVFSFLPFYFNQRAVNWGFIEIPFILENCQNTRTFFFFVRLNLNHDFEVWNLPFATIPRNMPHDFCFPHFYQTLSIKF